MCLVEKSESERILNNKYLQQCNAIQCRKVVKLAVFLLELVFVSATISYSNIPVGANL